MEGHMTGHLVTAPLLSDFHTDIDWWLHSNKS